jgi:RIO kinase 1
MDFETDQEFVPTMTLTGREREWVLDALGGFFQDRVLTDILYRVKGGKEATVFCCRADPSTGFKYLAAKIFRPRMFRAMKNDALYREGRTFLDEEGKSVTDSREMRALRKKTRFGNRLNEASWHQHEYGTLQLFHATGADVPKPFAQAGNTILMEYIGDLDHVAPTLHEVALDPSEARPLFERVMRNIELFLSCHRVHADLSAYNVLYWQGEVKIIDFPQAVDAMMNHHAYFLLSRDIERICQYFAKQGVQANPAQLTAELWARYLRGEL